MHKLAFRMLLSNLPQTHDESVRPDVLHFYYDKKLNKDHYLGTTRMRNGKEMLFSGSIRNESHLFTVMSSGPMLNLHFRGTADDWTHGFIGEVTVMPAAPDSGSFGGIF